MWVIAHCIARLKQQICYKNLNFILYPNLIPCVCKNQPNWWCYFECLFSWTGKQCARNRYKATRKIKKILWRKIERHIDALLCQHNVNEDKMKHKKYLYFIFYLYPHSKFTSGRIYHDFQENVIWFVVVSMKQPPVAQLRLRWKTELLNSFLGFVYIYV